MSNLSAESFQIVSSLAMLLFWSILLWRQLKVTKELEKRETVQIFHINVEGAKDAEITKKIVEDALFTNLGHFKNRKG